MNNTETIVTVLPSDLRALQLLREGDEKCLQMLTRNAEIRAELERIWVTSTDHAGQGIDLG